MSCPSKFPWNFPHVPSNVPYFTASTRPRNHRRATIALESRRSDICSEMWGDTGVKLGHLDGKWMENGWKWLTGCKSGWTWPICRWFEPEKAEFPWLWPSFTGWRICVLELVICYSLQDGLEGPPSWLCTGILIWNGVCHWLWSKTCDYLRDLRLMLIKLDMSVAGSSCSEWFDQVPSAESTKFSTCRSWKMGSKIINTRPTFYWGVI